LPIDPMSDELRDELVEHSAVETQIARVVEELHWGFEDVGRAVVAETVRRSLRDLQGSVLPADLPEMVSRLATWRLDHLSTGAQQPESAPNPALSQR